MRPSRPYGTNLSADAQGRSRHRTFFAFLLAGALIGSCATPIPPTGGPVDDTPPALVSSEPEPGTVNFTGDHVTFFFSERVDAASLRQALNITPEPLTPPEIGVKRGRVTITFSEPLRDSTTYIFTLDNRLKDLHNVSLSQPITMALATGPIIDQGRLRGDIVHPETSRPVGQLDVYAYALSDSVPPDPRIRPPDFRTQTGTDGVFNFEYLPELDFFLLGLDDRNRNRRADPGETFAVPPRPALRAVQAESLLVPVRLYTTAVDTVPPEVQRIRGLASRRTAVRFTEPVRLDTLSIAPWSITDSLTGASALVRAVFAAPGDPFTVTILSDSLPERTHTLVPGAVVDTASNPVVADPSTWIPPARPDTASLRFLGFLPSPPLNMEDSVHVLAPDEVPGLRLTQPADSVLFRSVVALYDSAGAAVTFRTSSEDGVSWSIDPLMPWPDGMRFRLTVAAPGADTVHTRLYRRLPESDQGRISGVVASTVHPVLVDLRPERRGNRTRARQTRTDSAGVFVFESIPEGAYFLRAFADLDRNGAWSGGLPHPYAPYEPLHWHGDSLSVRPRWTTSPSDTLTLRAHDEPTATDR